MRFLCLVAPHFLLPSSHFFSSLQFHLPTVRFLSKDSSWMEPNSLEIDSKFQSKKCPKRYLGDDDRISRLPDDILIGILSLMSLKEAARTSILSFRWINLWKHTSGLIFYADSALDKIAMEEKVRSGKRHEYVTWVNCILQSHKAATLKIFRICFDLNNSAREAIDQWLAYAFSRKVQMLELDLLSNFNTYIGSPSLRYVFPEEFLTQSVVSPLQTPSDTSCIHPPPFDFKHLKALSLKCVIVTGEAIEFFLRNCPVLEQLIVHYTEEISNLEVSGSSLMLKHLEICHCRNVKSIKVSAPNLTSLKVPILKGLLLENVPMLVDISIDCWFGESYVTDLLTALSCCISQLESLSLLHYGQKNSMEFPEMPEMPKLKKLVIECRTMRDRSLSRLTSLIRASPYLQEFVLKLHRHFLSSPDTEVVNYISFPHEHLKVVKFSGFYGRATDVELVKYFLENCVVLQKVIVVLQKVIVGKRLRSVSAVELIQGKQQLEAEVPQHIELVFL